MGKRGPRPTPTAVLRARGSRRADRNPDRLEPEPPPGPPECPAWLNADAKVVWDQMVALLGEMGVLTKADGNALARYATMFVQWRQAQEFVLKHGFVYPLKSGTGVVKGFGQFPQVAIAARLSLALLKIEAEYGLTPSSRARIDVNAGDGLPEDSAWLAELTAPFRHLIN